MRKRNLIESLESLQEYDFMGGPGMEFRPDYSTGARDPRNSPKNFKSYVGAASGDGPWNAQGRGPQGVGRGGVGWGGRPDDSGGPPLPRFQGTWEGAEEAVEEGADWDELQRHGRHRNIWRDTEMGKEIKHDLERDESENELSEQWDMTLEVISTSMDLLESASSWMGEAMGSPTQLGQSRPTDFPLSHTGRDARPVVNTDGTSDVPEANPLDPRLVDPQTGPGTQWGAHTFGDRSARHNLTNEENRDMNIREFFDPKPVAVEEIDNPDQDKHGDSTDDELEAGDHDGMENDGDEEEELQVVGSDDDGDDLTDLVQQLTGMSDSEPGDGDDLGAPAGNIMLSPKFGQTDFVMSPDRMGSARGLYGMHSDGAGHASVTDKSSAWDVLKKVIDAMSQEEDDADVMNPLTKG